MAAIAGELAATLHKLDTVASAIQDSSTNTTRFLVLGKETVPPSGHDKTSFWSLRATAPGIAWPVAALEENGISLTRIDSRPSKTEKWTYVFYIECEGHLADEVMVEVIGQIEEHSIMLKRLGSYPRAPI